MAEDRSTPPVTGRRFGRGPESRATDQRRRMLVSAILADFRKSDARAAGGALLRGTRPLLAERRRPAT